MIKVYHKVTTIEAEQFDGSDKMVKKYNITPPMPLDPDYTINTMEGDMVLGVGDWISTGVNGENWAISDDVFKKTYAELPVIPKYVADYIDMLKNSTDVVTASIGALEYGWGEIKLINWIDENGNTFARAWLDGYQIEED